MIKRLLMKTIALAAIASTAYTLTLLDQAVQGMFLSSGLPFDINWANRYWTLLRVTWALLAICAVAITVNSLFIFRPSSNAKQRNPTITLTPKEVKNIPVTTQTTERAVTIPPAHSPEPPQEPTPKPTPIVVPAPSHTSTDLTDLFKCTHCGKAFTQPLRMLDFHGDPPRIVNVCPFCSETMSSDSSAKESEQNGHKSLFKKDRNHGQKLLTR